MNREQSLNIDPRQLQAFMKSPDFVASLSPESHQTAQYRILTAKWSSDARIVYDAVQEGYTSMDQLPLATGLTTSQIRKAVSFLTERGIVKGIAVEPIGEVVSKE